MPPFVGLLDFSSNTPKFGIVADNGGTTDVFPLMKSRVAYDLVDVQLLATLVQTYTAKTSLSTQASYMFPLPPDGAVCSFKAIIDGTRTIEGIVREKEQAKREYDAVIAQGKIGALLEQHNVEIFQISLGNLNPGQTIEVHITFCSIITHDGGLDSLRLTFPTAIAPRYSTSPAIGLTSRNFNNTFLEFSLAIQLSSPIKSVSSPSHPIAMKFGEHTALPATDFDATKAYVTLSSSLPLEKDIVMLISCVGLDKPRCFSELSGGNQETTCAYALTFVPRFQLPPLPEQEYIFLVDCSGSMSGGKMAAVRSALQIMVKSLPTTGTSFNVISFGSRHSLLWPSSVPYAAESVKVAGQHIDNMQANFGGTEIRAALEAAFNSWSNPKKPATVFVLTDGQAYDLEGVKSTISQAVMQTKSLKGLLRVFCMGIGDQASRAMCEDIARTGDGCSVFVGEMEPPHEKLMSLLRAARSAPVEELTVDWGIDQVFASNIEQAPSSASLGPIYPQFRTSIFAIIKSPILQMQTVRIRGSVSGRPVELNVPVKGLDINGAAALPNSKKLLHTLAARALVRRYEEQYEKDDKNPRLVMSLRPSKQDILRIALHYGVVSSVTSFVAIDESSNTIGVGTQMKKRPPPENPSFGGLFGVAGNFAGGSMFGGSSGSSTVFNTSQTGGSPLMGFGGASAFGQATFGAYAGASVFGQASFGAQNSVSASSTSTFGSGAPVFGGVSSVTTIDNSKNPKYLIESFARQQSFEGYFDGKPELYMLMVQDSKAPKMPDNFGTVDETKEKIWNTVLCIAYLETKLAEEKVVWELMVNKAIAWLDGILLQLVEADKTESVKENIYEAAKQELK
ncbi:hypothetical protein M422DRAFT_210327 [Sphaerobolus stellatus SS14]|uniref:Uncharacterized protein n=1 Tax=Sphaerobolus stellatus (strain SS14) TaxID=990650 RepID=A0A0C9VNW3_SPHS4|nr:hypothetical protein M422DRAFT_210327 [Sphaerobolus stellatus SS14]